MRASRSVSSSPRALSRNTSAASSPSSTCPKAEPITGGCWPSSGSSKRVSPARSRRPGRASSWRHSPAGTDLDVVQGLVALLEDLGVHPQPGDRAKVLPVSRSLPGPALPGGELRGDVVQWALQHRAAVLEVPAGWSQHAAPGDAHDRLGPAASLD